MDKVLSTRIDESVANRLDRMAKKLNKPKKKVIEEALLLYEQTNGDKSKDNVFRETSGAWNREESVEETVGHARAVFRKGMERHRP